MKTNNRKLNFFATLFSIIYILSWFSFVLVVISSFVHIFTNSTHDYFKIELYSFTDLSTDYQMIKDAPLQATNTFLHINPKIFCNTLPLKIFNFFYATITHGCLLLIVYYLKGLFQSLSLSVKKNNLFLAENTQRIRKIAYYTMAFGIIQSAVSAFFSLYMIQDFKIMEKPITLIPSMDFFDTILSSLFILIIAEIYSTGVKMREESQLTI